MFWYSEENSATKIQRRFRRNYGVNSNALSAKTIKNWSESLMKTGSIIPIHITDNRLFLQQQSIFCYVLWVWG